MANEEDKTVVEAGDTQVSAPAPAKGKSKLILFGGIGLGAIIIGVVVALFVLKPMLASSDAPAEETSTHATEPAKKAESSSHKKSESHGSKGETAATMYEINDIVINPAGTGGSRFLSVSFGFELDSPTEAETFRSREPIIRDALITILSSKTVAQLTDARQKEIIRYQIKKRVADLMKTEQLAGVYYTDFVLQ